MGALEKTADTAIHRRLQEFIHYAELQQLAYSMSSLQQEKMFHSLTVLSFFPGEGKTLFCAALALAYSEMCRAKVLIIDTATIQNKPSLTLKACFNGSAPQIDVKSLEDLRRSPNVPFGLPSPGARENKTPVLEPEILYDRPAPVILARDSDFMVIKKAAEDASRQYGLVLLDTASMQAKNKRNVEPLMTARLSDASVLVVSRAFLQSPELSTSLKTFEDPALHLLGIISNHQEDR